MSRASSTGQYSSHVTNLTIYEEVLLQVFYGVTWGGDLLSKEHRDEAVGKGHIVRTFGWNIITVAGVEFLMDAGVIKP